jgi:hypothetical protein
MKIRGLAWLAGIGVLGLTGLTGRAAEAVWQWSVPFGEGRAFLWIPENCHNLRAVVVAQHNMIEQGILEHAAMRRTLAALGMAEVFIAPPFDRVFRFDRDAGERFDVLMQTLAGESGYAELARAPVVPLGHSACASFPWNFAAWNPTRTLAILSVKGDAPQTGLTGSGAANPDWGAARLDGIPGLMVMSEQEWWEARLTPLLTYRAAYAAIPLAVLADTGHGHFDATDELVDYLAMFIRKAFAGRMPEVGPVSDRPFGAFAGRSETGPALKAVDPAEGWLVDRWRGDDPPLAPAATVREYRGPRAEAFWCFDEEMARITEAAYVRHRGKKAQQVDFVQAGEPAPISTTHVGVELNFLPESDGLTFRLEAEFITPLPPKAPVAAKDRPPPPVITLPTIARPEAHGVGIVTISPITGPIRQIAPDIFQIAFNRTSSTTHKRDHEIWLLARHPGDAEYRGAVQQGRLRLPRHTEGKPQRISFPAIADQQPGAASIELKALSDAGVPVSYYVREGPAYLEGNTLRFTPVPPRARFPVRVTVVAWQFGRGSGTRLKAAESIERSFFLTGPGAGPAP